MMLKRLTTFTKWFAPGIGIKRWMGVIAVGVILIAHGLSHIIAASHTSITALISEFWDDALVQIMAGVVLTILGFYSLSQNILAPYRHSQHGDVVDLMYAHHRRRRGIKVVAIGGGTGLPSVLRGLKHYTGNITAVVTMADNGGSSGRLRRDFGALPPGDLRNNIVALADDENLMARLFQYRFNTGDLGGHAFGNLFISALAGVTGSLEQALSEIERVLSIQGRVLPATMQQVHLAASIRMPEAALAVRIEGEAEISDAGGRIEKVELLPGEVEAYAESVQAILDADVVIVGPGSLYTSIVPNLLVKGISDAVRATRAYKIYVCNVATQPGETDNYTVADHVIAIENHVGRGIFQVVLANSTSPTLNKGITQYVERAPEHHEIFQRYDVRYADLADIERPWRHDPQKLAAAILKVIEKEGGSGQSGFSPRRPPLS